jgi:putative FmdB family regulatory protein
MPLYEYQCASCGKKTEVIQGFRDAPPEKCPHCGGKLRKLLSTPAFQFKGTGFYATDYKNVGGQGGESASKEKTGEGSSSEKAGGDAKPAGGAEAKAEPGGSSKEKKETGDSSRGERAGKDAGGRAAKEPAKSSTSNAPSRKKKSARD